MAASILATGEMIWRREREGLSMLTVMYMRVCGIVIRHKAAELMSIWMELSMSESGKKIVKMDMESKPGLTTLSTKVTMSTERNTVSALSNGAMDHPTLGSS